MKKASLQRISSLENASVHAFHFKTQGYRGGGFWHYHPAYEIVYLPAGNGRRFVGNTITRFADGDLVLLGADLPHNCFSAGFESEVFEEYVVQFEGEKIQQMGLYFSEFRKVLGLLQDASRGLYFERPALQKIGKELIKLPRLNQTERLLVLFRVLKLMSESKYGFLSEKQHLPVSSLNLERVRKVYARIEKEYHRNLSSNEVARELGMTHSSFCRVFAKSTGTTFKQALSDVRIQKACDLLLQTTNPIKTIAFDSGFNSMSLFHRLFKEKIQCTPSGYRKKFSKSVEV
ncbi:helix-turn-helix domain-containing protein [Flagellimonas allohymeniacidonis]|uniref:AraC family transcriptional regulator n=1 Tax=Flagellimonas allohymeniacidonis TaxID=2517819 RepID=A0A4Q8QAQ7_9FLAO|nr:AraC family transcriptional regulator [Allomuricauda hymeniacidonis]TAI46734.1 AraC family transcriptional regulator [Allomuricauda hymeniacidonis]